MPRHNVYRDGRVHVQKEMCSTCIFRPGNLMDLRSGRVRGMIEEAKSKDGGTIICHQTLDAADNAICRGFYDRHADDDFMLRTAKGCDLIAEVEPGIEDVTEKMTEADAHE